VQQAAADALRLSTGILEGLSPSGRNAHHQALSGPTIAPISFATPTTFLYNLVLYPFSLS